MYRCAALAVAFIAFLASAPFARAQILSQQTIIAVVPTGWDGCYQVALSPSGWWLDIDPSAEWSGLGPAFQATAFSSKLAIVLFAWSSGKIIDVETLMAKGTNSPCAWNNYGVLGDIYVR